MLSPKWTATMDAAVADPRAAAYDQTVQSELRDYTARLGSTRGYVEPSFRLIKALLLIESGGPAAPSWRGRVAQIGNLGDPGYGVLKAGAENSALVMSPDLRARLADTPINDPILNVRAAIALIFTKAVQAATTSVVDPADPLMRQHIVGKGDSFSRIAQTERSTVPDIRASNPAISPTLRLKEKVNYHHASMINQISGWNAIDAGFLARRYNGGGDPDYGDKLNYVLAHLR